MHRSREYLTFSPGGRRDVVSYDAGALRLTLGVVCEYVRRCSDEAARRLLGEVIFATFLRSVVINWAQPFTSGLVGRVFNTHYEVYRWIDGERHSVAANLTMIPIPSSDPRHVMRSSVTKPLCITGREKGGELIEELADI
jgi:hypothetical protein